MTDRVAIYARVSGDQQAERQTIASQMDACHEFVTNHGYEVVAEFRDEAVSGATPFDERPEGRRLLMLGGDGVFDRVVVYSADRLARDVVEAGLAMRTFKKLRLPVDFVSQSFDDTPEGIVQFQMLSVFAEYERQLIRRRTMAGRVRRVKSGKYQASQAPFGYTYDQEAGQLEIDPLTGHVVQQMFTWAQQDLGLQAIASRLEKEGIAPPSPKHPRRRSQWGWHFTTVYKILTHRRYTGQGSYGGEPMTCPALVDESLFDRVQEALKGRRLNASRNTKNFYMLQHLVFCRTCGGRYTPRMVSDPRGRKEPYAIYHCYRRSSYGPKAGHEDVQWRWRANELEERVTAAVRALYDGDVGELQSRMQVESLIDQYSGQGQRAEQLESRLQDLAAEEMRVLLWGRKGYIEEAAMLQQLDQVRAERQDVEHELKLARKAAEDIDFRVAALEFIRGLPRAKGFYDEATGEPVEPSPQEWRDLIRAVVDAVWVERDGSITLEGPFSVASALKSFR